MSISPLNDLELQNDIETVDGLPVNREVMFTDKKGRHKPGVEKRQRKLIKQCHFIKPFLEPGETIQRVTTGCSPMTFGEQFFTGWIIFYIKRAMFIFTDRRIFHVPSTAGFKYRKSIAQIRFDDCRELSVKRHVMRAHYNNGDKEKFYYIPGPDRGVLQRFLSQAATGSEKGRRTHLCPTCQAPLSPKVYQCASCAQEFKTRKDATLLSWVFPGGGYFYTGHYLLGVSDAITELLLTFFVVMSLMNVQSEGGFFPAVMFGFILVIEKLMTVSHALGWIDEFIPIERPGLARAVRSE